MTAKAFADRLDAETCRDDDGLVGVYELEDGWWCRRRPSSGPLADYLARRPVLAGCGRSAATSRLAVTDDDTWVGGWDELCVSLVRGLTPVEAAEAIAQADVQEFDNRVSAANWVFASGNYDRSQFATGEVDAWTFIWEENGFQGVAREKGRLLAEASELCSMFWNVNAVMAFLAARGGRVIRHFDPLFHDDPAPSLDIGPALDASGVRFWAHRF